MWRKQDTCLQEPYKVVRYGQIAVIQMMIQKYSQVGELLSGGDTWIGPSRVDVIWIDGLTLGVRWRRKQLDGELGY